VESVDEENCVYSIAVLALMLNLSLLWFPNVSVGVAKPLDSQREFLHLILGIGITSKKMSED
jgi:hypothetical protein